MKEYVYMMRQCGKINQWQIRKVKRKEITTIADHPNLGMVVCTCYNKNVALNIFKMISEHVGDIFQY